MEVHHHAHLASGETHTARKKWTHYFWEFFMLFLAVSAGFFVENQREHFIEHQREKQYIRSMTGDLKSDTTQLSSSIQQLITREIMIDSFVTLLHRPDYKKYGNEIYFFGRNISYPAYFFSNDRTIQQLKNSGGLRLIRKMEVSDSIMAYDYEVRYLMFEFTDEMNIRAEFRQTARDKFNGFDFFLMLDIKNPLKIKRPEDNPQLFSNDAASINELITQAQYVRNATRRQRFRQQGLKNKAITLISFLQKEYHLE